MNLNFSDNKPTKKKNKIGGSMKKVLSKRLMKLYQKNGVFKKKSLKIKSFNKIKSNLIQVKEEMGSKNKGPQKKGTFEEKVSSYRRASIKHNLT